MSRWHALHLAALVCLPALTPRPAAAQVVAIVEVRVTSEAGGDPVGAATVSFPGLGLSADTDDGGRAVFRGLAPGTHALRVVALGFRPAGVDVTAENGRTVRLAVSLAPSPLPVQGLDVSALDGPGSDGGMTVAVDALAPSVRDVPAALEGFAGVTVVRSGGPGAPATLQIRGSGADEVLVLLDGVPINSPMTGEADLNGVDLASLERIVVLPGARSARYGPRALGGVVLLETRESTTSAGRLTMGLGAWGAREISGDGTWVPSPAWTLAAGGQWSRADGDFTYEAPDFRGGGEATRSNAAFRRLGGHLQATAALDPVDLSVRIHGSDVDRGSPGTVAQPSLSGTQRHRRHGADTRIGVGDADLGGSALLSLQRQRAEYRDSAPPFGAPYDQASRADQRELSGEAWSARGPWTLRAGAEVRRTDVSASGLDAADAPIDEGAVWTRGEWTTTAGRRTRVEMNAAVRVDRHDLVDGLTVSPALTAGLQHRDTRLEASVRNGFAPPSLADLFFHEGVLVRPNPELGPERVRGEVAVSLDQRIHLGAWELDARIAAYRADVDGMILWYPDYRFVWSPDNYDVARRGLEAGIAVDVPAFGRRHALSGQAAWSEVEYDGPVLTGQVAYRPVFTADAQASVDTGIGRLTVAADHVGERRSQAGSDLNVLPPYTRLDVGLGLPLTLGSVDGQLDLAVTNLLDEAAALLVDYPLPGRGWSVRVRLAPSRP